MKTRIGYDENKASSLPSDFLEAPPAGHEDQEEDEALDLASKRLLNSAAAHRAGSVLQTMDKNDVDALYKSLAPAVRQLRWFRSRYKMMQKKIWYLSDQEKKLTDHVMKLRAQVQSLGHDPVI